MSSNDLGVYLEKKKKNNKKKKGVGGGGGGGGGWQVKNSRQIWGGRF